MDAHKNEQNIKSDAESFDLSRISSLYFGEEPDAEAKELLEEAYTLLREDSQAQRDWTNLMNENYKLRSKAIYFDGNVLAEQFNPMIQIKKLFSRISALSEEGGKLDYEKAKLELTKAELKRRKQVLQRKICTYESNRLNNFPSLTSNSKNNNDLK